MPVTVEVAIARVGFCRQRAWLADGSSLLREVRFPASIAVIRHPGLGTILFDTGYGRALELDRSRSVRLYRCVLPFELPERERVSGRLSQLGVGRVDLIVISHFHPDHIGGLREVLGTPPILHSSDGLARLRAARGLNSYRSLFFPGLLPEDFPARAQAIEDLPPTPAGAPFGDGGDVAGDGSLIAVALPGHAAGHYGLLCRLEGGRRIFLCADAAWLRTNIFDGALPPWPARVILDDAAAFAATLGRLREFARGNPDVQVVPCHCEESIAAYGTQD